MISFYAETQFNNNYYTYRLLRCIIRMVFPLWVRFAWRVFWAEKNARLSGSLAMTRSTSSLSNASWSSNSSAELKSPVRLLLLNRPPLLPGRPGESNLADPVLPCCQPRHKSISFPLALSISLAVAVSCWTGCDAPSSSPSPDSDYRCPFWRR